MLGRGSHCDATLERFHSYLDFLKLEESGFQLPGLNKSSEIDARSRSSMPTSLASISPTQVLLQPLRRGYGIFNSKKMSAGKHREIHDVKHTEKVIPFITGEITFGQHVCQSPPSLSDVGSQVTGGEGGREGGREGAHKPPYAPSHWLTPSKR